MRGRPARLKASSFVQASRSALGVGAVPARRRGGDIDGYRVAGNAKTLRVLARLGFDVSESRRGKRYEIAGTRRQIAKLAKAGVKAEVIRDEQGRTSSERSQQESRSNLRSLAPAFGFSGDDSAYTVWRKYDANPADTKQQYMELYDSLRTTYGTIVRKRVIGKTYFGRDIVAVQVTKGAEGTNKPQQARRPLQRAPARA